MGKVNIVTAFSLVYNKYIAVFGDSSGKKRNCIAWDWRRGIAQTCAIDRSRRYIILNRLNPILQRWKVVIGAGVCR